MSNTRENFIVVMLFVALIGAILSIAGKITSIETIKAIGCVSFGVGMIAAIVADWRNI